MTPEFRQNELFQMGRRLYKVSEVYEKSVTAQQLYPLMPRTTVVRILNAEMAAHALPPSKALIRRYNHAYGFKEAR